MRAAASNAKSDYSAMTTSGASMPWAPGSSERGGAGGGQNEASAARLPESPWSGLVRDSGS